MRLLKCNLYVFIVVTLVLCNCFMLLQLLKEGGTRYSVPSPPSDAEATKVLYCLASASVTQRLDVIETLLQGCQDWCEAGFSTTIIIDTFEHFSNDFSAKLSRRFECPAAKMSVRIVSHERYRVDGSESNLILYHRDHFKKHLYEYDIFLLGEDDMSIRLSTLAAWRRGTAALGRLADTHMVGLVRYEDTLPALREKKVRERVVALLAQEAPSTAASAHITAMSQAAALPPTPPQHTSGHASSNGKQLFSTEFTSNRVTWELPMENLKRLYTCVEGEYGRRQQEPTAMLRTGAGADSCVPTSKRRQYLEFAPSDADSSVASPSINHASSSAPQPMAAAQHDPFTTGGRLHPPLTLASSKQNVSALLPYSAAGLYTRRQLQLLEDKCQFLSTHAAYKHWENGLVAMQVFHASQQPFHCGAKETVFGSGIYDFTSPEFYCCMKWVLPVDEVEALLVHHIGTPGVNGDRKWTNRHRIGKIVGVGRWHESIDQLPR